MIVDAPSEDEIADEVAVDIEEIQAELQDIVMRS